MRSLITELPAERFSHRRIRVQGAMNDGLLILPAAPILKRTRDMELRYRPDSEFYYLTGSPEPGMVAVLGSPGGSGYVLFVPRRDPAVELWSGPRLGPEEAQEMFGADAVYPIDEMEERLPEMLRAHRRVFFRLGQSPRIEKLVLDALVWARAGGARSGTGPRSVEDPGALLDDLRLVKDPDELTLIRQATRLTVDAFSAAIAGTRPGMGEWEVEAELESAFRKGGAAAPAFPTIVGSGNNGCTLHYVKNGSRIGDQDLVLLDGGAEVGLYAGDVTRTYPAGGRFAPPQLDVYSVVLGAQKAAISRVGPGRRIEEVHEAALEALTAGLIELGVLKGRVGELLEMKAYEAYFPHRTSHWLGLDVHDVGDYRTNSGSRVLEPGMVLTVEPGLYFPTGPGEHPSHLGGMGVRIEDDLLVTETGYENLTEALPVDPPELEALVGSALKG
jgi:Xaa-Pro aminopeptidase